MISAAEIITIDLRVLLFSLVPGAIERASLSAAAFWAARRAAAMKSCLSASLARSDAGTGSGFGRLGG